MTPHDALAEYFELRDDVMHAGRKLVCEMEAARYFIAYSVDDQLQRLTNTRVFQS